MGNKWREHQWCNPGFFRRGPGALKDSGGNISGAIQDFPLGWGTIYMVPTNFQEYQNTILDNLRHSQ